MNISLNKALDLLKVPRDKKNFFFIKTPNRQLLGVPIFVSTPFYLNNLSESLSQ